MGAPRKLDARRLFGAEEKAVLFLLANGRCQGCGEPLGADWHADHIIPWSAAGRTELTNAQALCVACNLWKGARGQDAPPRPVSHSLRPSSESVRFAKNNIQRILARLRAAESGCLEWTGKRRPDGYGVCMFEKRWIRVHRFLWEHFNQPLEAGLVIHHICRNRLCANPWHLEPRTRADNSRDEDTPNRGQAQRDKTHCAHGHPFESPHLRINSRGERYCGTCRSRRKKAKWRADAAKRAPKPRPRRAVCAHGHSLDGENLYLSPSGERHCRTCRRASITAYNARQKALSHG